MGCCLLAEKSRTRVWLPIMGVFAAFSVVSIYRYAVGIGTCGCFGAFKMPSNYMFLIDTTILGAMAIAPQLRSSTNNQLANLVIYAAYLMVAFGVLQAVSPTELVGQPTTQNPRPNRVLLEPGGWMHQAFPLVDYVDGGVQLLSGTWRVLLYRHDCPDCNEKLSQIQKESTPGISLALLEIPPFGSSTKLFNVDAHLKLHPDVRWYARTPIEFFIVDGIVKSVADLDG